jgi:hypothetical protein
MDDKPLRGAELAQFERVRQHYIHIVKTAIREHDTGIKHLTLQQSLGSMMPTGTKFTAVDITGRVFTGHIVSHSASASPHSGSLVLSFDEPMTVLNYVLARSGHIEKIQTATYLARVSNSAMDANAGNREARYLGTTTNTVTLLRKNGDVSLHKGQVVEVKREKRT